MLVLTQKCKDFIAEACGGDMQKAREIASKAETVFNCEQPSFCFRIRSYKEDEFTAGTVSITLSAYECTEEVEDPQPMGCSNEAEKPCDC